MSRPFQNGAQGSKIVVTTRSDKVAKIMRSVSSYFLKILSNEDCLRIFVSHALGREDFAAHSKLEKIGGQIVKKCKGLPLAVKALGGVLRSTEDVQQWERILKSEIWDLTDEESNILPTLRLSYHYLPAHLKRCFAYCSPQPHPPPPHPPPLFFFFYFRSPPLLQSPPPSSNRFPPLLRSLPFPTPSSIFLLFFLHPNPRPPIASFPKPFLHFSSLPPSSQP
ncbi:hypothetical protein UlMin_043094 [Ulmus minor]